MFCGILHEFISKEHWGLGCEMFFLLCGVGDQILADILHQLEVSEIRGLCQGIPPEKLRQPLGQEPASPSLSRLPQICYLQRCLAAPGPPRSGPPRPASKLVVVPETCQTAWCSSSTNWCRPNPHVEHE